MLYELQSHMTIIMSDISSIFHSFFCLNYDRNIMLSSLPAEFFSPVQKRNLTYHVTILYADKFLLCLQTISVFFHSLNSMFMSIVQNHRRSAITRFVNARKDICYRR